jgi:hypothetical protein
LQKFFGLVFVDVHFARSGGLVRRLDFKETAISLSRADQQRFFYNSLVFLESSPLLCLS